MTELAQGYLSLSVGLDHPGASVAKWLSTQQKAVDVAGKAMGKSLSGGLNLGAERAKADAEQAKRAFDIAAKAATAASEKQEAAARKVQIAEAKLTETREKYAKDSSQVLTAEDRLATAKGAAAKASLSVTAAEAKQATAADKVKAALAEQTVATGKAATESERSAGKIRTAFSKIGAKLPDPLKQMISQASTDGEKAGARFSERFSATGTTGATRLGGKAFSPLIQAASGAGLASGAAYGASMGKKVKASMAGVASSAVVGLMGAAAVGKFVSDSFNLSAGFEKQLSAIQAVSGASQAEMAKLKQKSMELGAASKYSTTEAATAIENLVKAGLSVSDVMNGAAESSVNLAAAGEVPLDQSAELISNVKNAFQLQAKDLPKIADLISGAANASAIGVEDFGYSLSQVGAVAHQTGMNITDTSTAIAELGNMGIKGSDAGTSLKTMLVNLNPQTTAAANAMERYGLMTLRATDAQKALATDGIKGVDTSSVSAMSDSLTKYYQKHEKLSKASAKKMASDYMSQNNLVASAFYDKDGNFLGLKNAQQKMKESLSKLSDQEKSSATKALFGTDAMRAAGVLMTNGSKGYDQTKASMGKVTAQQTAQIRQKNFASAKEQFGGTLENVRIKATLGLLPLMSKALNGVTAAMNAASSGGSKFGAVISPLVDFVKGLLKVVGPLIGDVLKLAGGAVLGALYVALKALSSILGPLGKSMEKHPAIWRAVALAVGTAVVAFNGAAIATKGLSIAGSVIGVVKALMGSLVTGIKAVGVAMSANTIGLVIAAVAALVVGFIYAYKHSEKFRNVVNGVLNGVKNVALAVGRWFAGPFVNFFKAAWDGIKSGFSAVGNFFTGAWDGIKSGASATTNWFKGPFVNAFKSAWSGVKSGASSTGGFFTTMWHGIQSDFTAGVEKVKAIWSALKTIFAPVVKIAMDGVLTVLRNLWNVLGGVLNVFIGLFTGNWSRMWHGIKGIVSGTLGAIRAIFQTFGAVMLALGLIFLTALGVVWRAAWNGMKAAGIAIWNGIKAALSATWNGMKAAFWAVVHWFPTAWRAAWNAVKNAGIAIWNAIKAGFRAEINGWKIIFSAAINFFKAAWRAGWNWIKAVGAAIWNGIKIGVSGFFNGVRSLFTRGINAIKWLWSGGWKSLLSSAMNLAGRIHNGIHDFFVNKIPAAFRSAVTAIKKAWDGLQAVAKAPVKFVVNTVLNGGLIGGFNWVANKLGATPIKPIKLPPGFAGGGFVDLPWSAQNRDPYLGMSPHGAFRFEGEEFITNRAATRQSRGALEAINSGQLNDKILGFANGGFTGGRGHLTDLAASRVRAAAQSLGWMFQLAQQGWNAANGLSGTSHAGDAVDVSGPAGGTRLWSIRDALRKQNWAAWVRGPAENFSWHVHAVPGPGAGTPRGSAVWQWSDYLAGGGGLHGSGTPDPYAKPSSGGSWLSQIGSAVSGLFGKFASPVDWIKNKFKSLGNVVSKFGDNAFTQMIAKVPANLANAAISKVTSLFGLSSGPSGSSSNAESWRGLVKQALARSGIGGGKSDEDKWLRQIMSESSGNPNLVQSSAVYDVNIAHGDPARGLVQVPGVTWADFGKDMGGFSTNWMNPLKNLIVGMRAAAAQHKNWRNVIGFGHGYASGTDSALPGAAWLAEEGPELVVGRQMANLTAGSRVYNATQTAQMLGGGSGPSVMIVKDVNNELIGRVRIESYDQALNAIDDNADKIARVGA